MTINYRVRTWVLVLLLGFGWSGAGTAKTELQDAVKANDIERVQAALAAGADIDETDVYQGALLHMAAENQWNGRGHPAD